MEFTHSEASMVISALGCYLADYEEKYYKALEVLEDGYLICPDGAEKLREIHEKLEMQLDIQEKIFATHPDPQSRQELFEELAENREVLSRGESVLSSLSFYQSPSSQDEDEGCDKDGSCSLADTKSPDSLDVEKVEVSNAG